MEVRILWLDKPEENNYPAAYSYLSLIFPPKVARKLVKKLRKARVTEYKAKDIFRASELSLLGISNSHVKKDQAKIKCKKHLSPLLLVRDPRIGKVIIADGYHRLCAVYSFHEDTWIRCKSVTL